MAIKEIKCIERDGYKACPFGWQPYNAKVTYTVEGHIIKLEKILYALNTGEANKYLDLILEDLGASKNCKKRIDKMDFIEAVQSN